MSDDYLWDPTGDPEPAIRELEDTLAVLRFDGTWRPVVHQRRRRMWFGVAAGAAAVAAGVVVLLARPRNGHVQVTREPVESEAPGAGSSTAPPMRSSRGPDEVCPPRRDNRPASPTRLKSA